MLDYARSTTILEPIRLHVRLHTVQYFMSWTDDQADGCLDVVYMENLVDPDGSWEINDQFGCHE